LALPPLRALRGENPRPMDHIMVGTPEAIDRGGRHGWRRWAFFNIPAGSVHRRGAVVPVLWDDGLDDGAAGTSENSTGAWNAANSGPFLTLASDLGEHISATG